MPTTDECPHADLMPYLSSYLAGNAVELHHLANGECRGVQAFPCGDHWHMGHLEAAAAGECRAAAAAALEDRHNRRAPRRRGRSPRH